MGTDAGQCLHLGYRAQPAPGLTGFAELFQDGKSAHFTDENAEARSYQDTAVSQLWRWQSWGFASMLTTAALGQGEETVTHTEHCRLCLVESVLLRLGPHTKFLLVMTAAWHTVLSVIKPRVFQCMQGFAVHLSVREGLARMSLPEQLVTASPDKEGFP